MPWSRCCNKLLYWNFSDYSYHHCYLAYSIPGLRKWIIYNSQQIDVESMWVIMHLPVWRTIHQIYTRPMEWPPRIWYGSELKFASEVSIFEHRPNIWLYFLRCHTKSVFTLNTTETTGHGSSFSHPTDKGERTEVSSHKQTCFIVPASNIVSANRTSKPSAPLDTKGWKISVVPSRVQRYGLCEHNLNQQRLPSCSDLHYNFIFILWSNNPSSYDPSYTQPDNHQGECSQQKP